MTARRVLIAHASKHGATAEIAAIVAEVLRDEGHDVTISPADPSLDPEGFDTVVLGSAVYAASWRDEALGFARRHAPVLSRTRVWLFSSGPLGDTAAPIHGEPRQLAELHDLLRPEGHVVFGGLFDPGRFGFVERSVVRAFKARPGDYRDWDRIRDWAAGIAAALES